MYTNRNTSVMKYIKNTGSDASKSGLKNTGAANRGAAPTLAYKCTAYVFDEFARRGYLNPSLIFYLASLTHAM